MLRERENHMALENSDVQKIVDNVEKAMRKVLEKTKKVASASATFGKTERRLYAYPVLKQNIVRHKADIEDVKHEDMGRSKDIVLYRTNSGKTPETSLEELRAEKIFAITEKIHRDQAEVDEIETALESIKEDPYYYLIPMLYFEKRGRDEICELKKISRATSWRNSGRLVRMIELMLYGADALK